MVAPGRWSSSDRPLEHVIERLDGQMTVIGVSEFHDRSPVANAETAVHDLYGQLAIGSRSAVDDAVSILQFVYELLRAHHEAGHPVAEEHEVIATRLGAEVGIEGQEAVNAVRGRAEMRGHHLGGLERDPTEVFVD